MISHPQNEPKIIRRFTAVEDERLRDLVGQFGARKWRRIAVFMPGRTDRQCRDRYFNYLSPDFYNDKWTHEDDELLLQKHNEFGPQWSKMVHFFPGKTANNIKNRWNYSVCRLKEQREMLERTALARKLANAPAPTPNGSMILVPKEMSAILQTSLKTQPEARELIPPIGTFLSQLPTFSDPHHPSVPEDIDSRDAI